MLIIKDTFMQHIEKKQRRRFTGRVVIISCEVESKFVGGHKGYQKLWKNIVEIVFNFRD